VGRGTSRRDFSSVYIDDRVDCFYCPCSASCPGISPHIKKIADGKGVSGRTAFIKTILFGFTWWLALKKGIIEK
jgi:hypothetical protein